MGGIIGSSHHEEFRVVRSRVEVFDTYFTNKASLKIYVEGNVAQLHSGTRRVAHKSFFGNKGFDIKTYIRRQYFL